MKTIAASAYHLFPVTSCLALYLCTTSNHVFASSCRFVLVKNIVSESTISNLKLEQDMLLQQIYSVKN
jgi:hypothetical protein